MKTATYSASVFCEVGRSAILQGVQGHDNVRHNGPARTSEVKEVEFDSKGDIVKVITKNTTFTRRGDK